MVGGVRNTISTAELRLAQNRISVEEENRKAVQEKRQVAADSLQKYKLEILDLQNSSDTVGELGPLQYLSGLTGTPMDRIINILLLVIIFVFDPLAISLVIAANFAFNRAYPRLQENLYGELEKPQPIIPEDYDEKRMDIIGQNGNDGEHYEEDWKVVEEEPKKVKRVLQKTPSKRRVQYEDGTEGWLDKDDNRIIYM